LTDGLKIIGIEYPYDDIDTPDELINAYLAKHPSDLGKNTVEYEVETGWNLLSIPFVYADTSIEAVLTDMGIIDNVESVYTYKDREWKIYNPDPLVPDDLTTIDLGYSYWIKSNVSINFTKTGSALIAAGGDQLQPPPEVILTEGWNLIGIHAVKDVRASAYLKGIQNRYDSLWRYIPSPQGLAYGALDELTGDPLLSPGQGYWIHMTEAGSFVPSTAVVAGGQ